MKPSFLKLNLPATLAALFSATLVTAQETPPPPGPDPENAPPTCEVADQLVTAIAEFTPVTMTAMATDPDGDDLLLGYGWTLPVDSTATFDGATDTSSVVVLAPVGSTLVTLVVTDELGATSECTAMITVELPAPPDISCSVNPATMWPPNHKMTKVEIVVEASSEAVQSNSELVGTILVSSDEEDSAVPGDRPGDVHGHDGYTAPVELELDHDPDSDTLGRSIRLRSERQGSGDGRTYTIVCTVADPFGQTAEDSCTVFVPHDRRQGLPVAAQQAQKKKEARKARKKARQQRKKARRKRGRR